MVLRVIKAYFNENKDLRSGCQLANSAETIHEANIETGERKLILKNGANFVSLAFKISIVAGGGSARSAAIVTYPKISFTNILEDQTITPDGVATLRAVISPASRATSWFFGKSPLQASKNVIFKEDFLTGERSVQLLNGKNFLNLAFKVELRDDKTGLSTGCCLTSPALDYPPYGLSESVRQVKVHNILKAVVFKQSEKNILSNHSKAA